ncbi:hypothetical protein EUGRSUZ_B02116 [Eucalyptus grandis]|uniref:Uncharacterized protein n=2 Tax=Eucalyptus grandis TaxID=71139 RepID=A0A059D4B2_EUCGR|nr:hypothetical protein EUGRSUZ_B02116 [Eucalyptus grandis]
MCDRLTGLPLPSDCCIFTVLERLRRSNKAAYTPCAVAIGPYHRQLKSLEPMEDHKLLDRIFGKPWILKDVYRDMTLLKTRSRFLSSRGCSKRHLVKKIGGGVAGEARGLTEVKHIIDALRLSFLPSMNPTPHRGNEPIKFSPRATELVATRSKCLFNIKFEDGELKISCLVLHDWIESLFRNIIAFEQCYYKNASNRNLISYMVFMDHLVDTPADTELLMDKGIVENWLSNKEAPTNLINAFCRETSMLRYEYYFHSLSNELVELCQRPYNKWKATLKRDYYSNPWVIISVIATVALLLLTVVQVVCSVLSLACPSFLNGKLLL